MKVWRARNQSRWHFVIVVAPTEDRARELASKRYKDIAEFPDRPGMRSYKFAKGYAQHQEGDVLYRHEPEFWENIYLEVLCDDASEGYATEVLD